MIKNTYEFKSKVLVFPGTGAWHFVRVPEETSNEINFFFAENKRGWGSLPVKVTVVESEWDTSIFFDKKSKTFMLPLKAKIRKEESIKEGDNIEVTLKVKT